MICQHCGRDFKPNDYAKARTPKFCSQPCFRQSVALLSEGQRRERFWSKVDKNGPVPEHRRELGQCWAWTGSRSTSERGQPKHGSFYYEGRNQGAHVVSWIFTHGDIPGRNGSRGTYVLHKCDNPACVNPSHLFLGTHTDNMADMAAKWRAHTPNQRLFQTLRTIAHLQLHHGAAFAGAEIKRESVAALIKKGLVCSAGDVPVSYGSGRVNMPGLLREGFTLTERGLQTLVEDGTRDAHRIVEQAGRVAANAIASAKAKAFDNIAALVRSDAEDIAHLIAEQIDSVLGPEPAADGLVAATVHDLYESAPPRRVPIRTASGGTL